MFEKELDVAVNAARVVGDYLIKRKDIEIDSEEGKDIKLSSDRSSEKMIIDIIQRHSNYPILTEERGEIPGKEVGGIRWIVDPLDGTANYYRGIGELSCVSIALWKGMEPILGVVYRFSVGELFCGIIGKGAFCNGNSIHTSSVAKTESAVIATGLPLNRNYETDSLLDYTPIFQKYKKVRMLGTAALMGALVASGKFDAYREDGIMLWDIAASTALVRAAGGIGTVELLENNKTRCRLFANVRLMEDANGKGL